jgi:hypothetical protein
MRPFAVLKMRNVAGAGGGGGGGSQRQAAISGVFQPSYVNTTAAANLQTPTSAGSVLDERST